MILNIIKELAADNSRLAKEAILKREINNELLKQVFVATLTPTIQYYIKKIPQIIETKEFSGDSLISLEYAIKELGLLANRTHTGNDGIKFLQNLLCSLNNDDMEVLILIIGRDLKCGVSESTVNKIWPGLIPETPYMRCSSFKDAKNINWEEQGIISQKKADGSFCYINHNTDGSVEIFTRGGNYYNADAVEFRTISNEVKSKIPRGMQIHGELLVTEDGELLNRQTGNGLANSILKGGILGFEQEFLVEVWDMIPIFAFIPKGKFEFPYEKRFSELSELISECEYIQPIESKVVYSMAQAMVHYQEMIANGFEGTILKLPSAIWEDKTSKQQFKVKIDFDVELEIVGFNDGKGKNEKTFGSIACKSIDGLLEVNISGFTDKQREEIWSEADSYIGKIVTVKSNCIMNPKHEDGKYSLFLPRFVEVRNDKFAADSLARIQEQYESIIKI